MMKYIIVTAFALLFLLNGVVRAEITMDQLVTDFNRKLIDLSRKPHAEIRIVENQIGRYAAETFGKHPGLVLAEARKLLQALPEYDLTLLEGYKEKYAVKKEILDLYMGSMNKENRNMYLAIGWNPTRVVFFFRQMLLSKDLSSVQFAVLSILTNVSDFKVYRCTRGQTNMLLLECLGDLFVYEYSFSKEGCFMPEKIQWMQPLSVVETQEHTLKKRLSK